MVEIPPANVGDACLIPGLGRFPREGNGNSLRYSCLENSMERGAWWVTVTVHGLQRVGHDLETTQQQEYLGVDTKDKKNQDFLFDDGLLEPESHSFLHREECDQFTKRTGNGRIS